MAEDNTELIESFKTDHLIIETEEEVAWTLDGEYGGDHMNVEIRNRKQAASIAISSKEDMQLLED